MNKVVVLLNGPPRSGKDTIATYMEETFYALDPNFRWTKKNGIYQTVIQCKAARPLYTLCEGAFGIEDWEDMLAPDKKEVPCSECFGMSPREAMIWFSEEVMKPKFGPQVFGDLAVKQMRAEALTASFYDSFCVYIFSDSGFEAEVARVVEYVGKENALLVNLHRPGCDFKGDSRGYLDGKRLGVANMTVANDGTIEDAAHPIMEWIDSRFCLLAKPKA